LQANDQNKIYSEYSSTKPSELFLFSNGISKP